MRPFTVASAVANLSLDPAKDNEDSLDNLTVNDLPKTVLAVWKCEGAKSFSILGWGIGT